MHPDLRLVVITDAKMAEPRSIFDVVEQCVRAGAPAVQLRAKTATARELLDQALVLREICSARGALLFLNDRFDVALAAGADGVHLGPSDIPLERLRGAVPPGFLIGYSTDDPEAAKRAEQSGASYIGCGAVFGTHSKHDVGDERIGVERLAEVVQAVSIPVIAIGGIDPDNVALTARAGAAGVAVISALMRAHDPADVVRRLLAPFGAAQ
jgi:thiamine-phosphate pyrophosphorylase